MVSFTLSGPTDTPRIMLVEAGTSIPSMAEAEVYALAYSRRVYALSEVAKDAWPALFPPVDAR